MFVKKLELICWIEPALFYFNYFALFHLDSERNVFNEFNSAVGKHFVDDAVLADKHAALPDVRACQ